MSDTKFILKIAVGVLIIVSLALATSQNNQPDQLCTDPVTHPVVECWTSK